MKSDQNYRISSDIMSRKAGSDTVLLNSESGLYFGLNPVGSRIWEMLSKKVPLSQIVTTLCAEYDASPKTIQRDVLTLLKDLHKRGLVDTF